jgi:hypothetical protein
MNGITATFTNGQVWAIIGLLAVFMVMMFVFFMPEFRTRFKDFGTRLDKIEQNEFPHIYRALQIINNNVKAIGIAVKNHPATRDIQFDLQDIPEYIDSKL